MSDYALELYARERLAAARDVAHRRRVLRQATPRPALRIRLGVALIRLGTWMQGCAGDGAGMPRRRLSHG